MDVGLHLPAALASAPSPAEVVSLCRTAGVRSLTVTGGLVEHWLRRPVPIVPLDPPAGDAISLGLLEIEEDVFRDSYDLARRSFAAALREWRQAVPLAPLYPIDQQFASAGLTLIAVDWSDVRLETAAEFRYANQATRALGAASLSRPCSFRTIRQWPDTLGADGLRQVFVGSPTTEDHEYEDALTYRPEHCIAVDLTSPSGSSRRRLLHEHAGRVAYATVAISDVRTWSDVAARLAQLTGTSDDVPLIAAVR